MPRQRPIEPEQPRSEPEILPPTHGRRHPYQTEWYAASGSSRIFVARPGPWSMFTIALLIGLIAGATLAILLGTLLIVVPIVALLIAGMMISNALRGRLRR
jgi:hypothetical protein